MRADHPLRMIREIANAALKSLSCDFTALYSSIGASRSRPSGCFGRCCCKPSIRSGRSGSWWSGSTRSVVPLVSDWALRIDASSPGFNLAYISGSEANLLEQAALPVRQRFSTWKKPFFISSNNKVSYFVYAEIIQPTFLVRAPVVV